MRHITGRIIFFRINLLFTYKRFLNLFTACWRMWYYQLSVIKIKLWCTTIRIVRKDSFSYPYSIFSHIYNNSIRCSKMKRTFPMFPNFCHSFFIEEWVKVHVCGHE